MNRKQPNIVFVFTDQHRKTAMNFWSKEPYRSHLNTVADPVYTPNLDAFAAESVVCANAFSNNPLCSPFRAMAFTGLFGGKNGVWNNCTPFRECELSSDVPTIFDILKQHGYVTGYVGKWHLEKPRPVFDKSGEYVGLGEEGEERYFSDGSAADNKDCWDTLIPKERQRGIDYLYAYNTNGYFYSDGAPPLSKPHYWDKDYHRFTAPDGKWSSAYETDIALEFMKQQAGKEPFALFLSFNPPHNPYDNVRETDPDMYEHYRGKDVFKRDNAFCGDRYNEYFTENKATPLYGDTKEQGRVYFSHVSGLDKQFARILEYLEEAGISDDTVVVFTADHGEMLASHCLMAKNVIYEEATGIPFLIRYPRKLKPHVQDTIFSAVDIMPTILGVVGLERAVPRNIHGMDFSGIWEEGRYIENQAAFFSQQDTKGIRTSRYSIALTQYAQQPLIFDNQKDPYQMLSLRKEDVPEKEWEQMMVQLALWIQQTGDNWYEDRVQSDWIPYHLL